MPGYLEQLPPTTQLDAVFYGVHHQVRTMADTLEAMHSEIATGKLLSTRELISGFDLSIMKTGHDRSLYGPVVRTDICAEVDEEPHRLLSVSDMFESTHLLSHQHVYPKRVEGYRGQEPESYSADYALSQVGFQGDIAVYLGNRGLSGNQSPDEPFGLVRDIPPRQIGDLPERDHERLTIVSDGILSRLAAVRLILDGGSARDVLTVLGHDVDYVAPNPNELDTASFV
jgi:hypothetical protein